MTQPTSQFEIAANTPNCHSATKAAQLSLNLVAVLSAFIERGQQGLNQVEAIKDCDVIDFYNAVWILMKHGLKFKPSTEKISSHTSATKNTTRFSLINISHGVRLLGLLERNPPSQSKAEEVAYD